MMVRADAVTIADVPIEFTDCLVVRVPKSIALLGARYNLSGSVAPLTLSPGHEGACTVRGRGTYRDGLLELEVRAVPPVAPQTVDIVVEAAEGAQVIVCDLVGEPAFLPERIEAAYESDRRTVRVALRIPNDGTAPCESGILWVWPSPGAAVHQIARQGEVLALSVDGERPGAYGVPLTLGIGEIALFELALVTEPGAASVYVDIEIDAPGASCMLRSADFALRHQGMRVDLAEADVPSTPLRKALLLKLRNDGETCEHAALSVEGDRITPVLFNLGTVHAGERRTIPVTIHCAHPTVPLCEADVRASVVVGDQILADVVRSYRFDVPGGHRSMLSYRSIGNRGEVEVRYDLANTGVAEITGYAVRCGSDVDLVYVADSLRVGDVPMADVDGRWNHDDAYELPALVPGEAATVVFRARSQTAALATVSVDLLDGERVVERSTVAIEFSPFAVRQPDTFEPALLPEISEALADDVAVSVGVGEDMAATADSVVDALPAIGTEEEAPVEEEHDAGPSTDASGIVAEHADPPAVRDDHGASFDPEQPTLALVPEEQMPAAPALAEAPAVSAIEPPRRLSAAAREFYGDGNVEIGRHVLVLLSCGPDDMLEAADALIAQYLPGLREGMFALSGHAYDSAALRAALAARLSAEGNALPAEAPPNEIVARALQYASLPGPLAEPFAQYRDAIVARVKAAPGDTVYDEIWQGAMHFEEVAA